MRKLKHIPIAAIFIGALIGYTGSFSWATSQVIKSGTVENCHNLDMMNDFLANTYPDIMPSEYKQVDSIRKTEVINSMDIPSIYRFLSIISGIPTPYNYVPNGLMVRSDKWTYCKSHIEMVKWYAINHKDISCEDFNDYWRIIHYTTPVPEKDENIEGYLDRMGHYMDSIEIRFKDFCQKHSPDSLKGMPTNIWFSGLDFTSIDQRMIDSLINN